MLTTKFKSNSTLFLRLLVSVLVLCLTPVTFAQQPPPPSGAYDAAPYLGQIRDTYVYGDIWERPNLSKRDRSMITVAVNQALYATNELRLHMGRALDNGVTQTELSEIIAHVLWYSGFPTGVNAARVAAEVFESRSLPVGDERFPGAPYLDDLIDGLVYGETWNRNQLSVRDRSLATIAVTLAGYQSDQLRVHLQRGLDNGVTVQEISELIAHVTLYSGFPTGVNASRMFADILRERGIPLPD